MLTGERTWLERQDWPEKELRWKGNIRLKKNLGWKDETG